MKAEITLIAAIIALGFVCYTSGIKDYDGNELKKLEIEKTRLEVEKLKYELSIYKENEERLK